MTKQAKYGILGIIGLFIIVPLGFLAIKLGVLLLGALFNHPAIALAASVAFVAGLSLGEKLK